jgi:hypothetical protein
VIFVLPNLLPDGVRVPEDELVAILAGMTLDTTLETVERSTIDMLASLRHLQGGAADSFPGALRASAHMLSPGRNHSSANTVGCATDEQIYTAPWVDPILMRRTFEGRTLGTRILGEDIVFVAP